MAIASFNQRTVRDSSRSHGEGGGIAFGMRRHAEQPAIRHNQRMGGNAKHVSRPLVGAIAIVLLGIAAVLSVWPGAASGTGAMLCGGSARVGVVMAALWLALPTRNRPAAWASLSITSAATGLVAVLAFLRVPFRILFPLAGTIML